jgi:hypothetical protein
MSQVGSWHRICRPGKALTQEQIEGKEVWHILEDAFLGSYRDP